MSVSFSWDRVWGKHDSNKHKTIRLWGSEYGSGDLSMVEKQTEPSVGPIWGDLNMVGQKVEPGVSGDLRMVGKNEPDVDLGFHLVGKT